MNTQITEDYVSFEIAKLLKEKGFDCKCHAMYDKDGHLAPFNFKLLTKAEKREFVADAPTLQIAMKWLRDVHKKVINVEYIDFLEHGEVWSYSVLDRNTFHEFTEKSESFTEHSYEEACEAAIKYCLENLI